ncbi:MAG: hypothetical protein CVU56_29405, partial [Deltaproteobacteria bacterium HGW-Deltaproteobacteria-14]
MFFDTENILLGVSGEFEVKNVVTSLAERGEVMILKAYADWGRYKNQQRQFLEEGVQMVFLPSYGISDKNRTDTAICVDAMEVLFTRPLIDTFCIVSGDSDFGVLAQRLRHHGKRVVGISAKSAASHMLVKQCHEFIFYETLVGQRVVGYSVEEGEARLQRALEKVVEDRGTEFPSSALKDHMRKLDPTFSERNYGASSFTRFLRSYENLVTVLEGGMVRVGGPPEEDVARSGARGRAPKLTGAAEQSARDVLSRAITVAMTRKKGPVKLSRLKDTMQELEPDFDELGLGFRTFTRFLLAFPDVVVIDRASNTAQPTPGSAAATAPSDAGGDDGRKSRGDRRGRRGRGGKPDEPAEAAAKPA